MGQPRQQRNEGNMPTAITRSKKTLEAIIISSTLAAFIGMFVAIVLLSELRNITGLSMPYLRAIILSAFPLAWLFSTITAYKNWNKINYSYDDNRITISRSQLFSTKETTSYGYENMGNVSVVQTRFGEKHNFGDIIIQQKGDQPIILRLIDNPSHHSRVIGKNISEKKIYISAS